MSTLDPSSVQEKPCFNCKKSIELTKLRIHEAQCRRMTYKCDKCLEIVQKCEQDAHDYEFHEIVSACLTAFILTFVFILVI